jgi:hypothetical protein
MQENASLDRQAALTLKNKADMQLSGLTGGFGELLDEQRKKFFKVAIKKTMMARRVRVVMMKNPGGQIPKLTWTGHVLYPASAGVPQPSAYRSAPTYSGVTLESKLMRAELHMDREVLEDNIERQALKGTATSFMGEKVASDIEQILLNGDTTSSTPTLTITNGIIKQAATNTASGSPSSLSRTLLRSLMEAMPEEYDDQPGMAFFTNRKARWDFRDTVANRGTALGDMVWQGGKPQVGYDDHVLYRVPLFPNNLGTGSNETVVMQMAPRNALLAFQRKVTMDTDFDVRAQKFIFVISLRLDVKFEHEPAVAKLTKVWGQ